jgi:hypothetical protein
MENAKRIFWIQVRRGKQFLIKVQAGGERPVFQQLLIKRVTGKDPIFMDKDEIECWIYDKSR